MSENITSKTEQQILSAAEKLFLERGFKATSTTDIAREADCNQALVHYYFRTKENLFNKIFDAKFETIMEFIDKSLKDDSDIFHNLRSVISAYFSFLGENRNTPYFIFNELIRNPERRGHIRKVFLSNKRGKQIFLRFCSMVGNAVKAGEIREIDPLDLIFDGISLVVFVFITSPIFLDLLGRDASCLQEFIEHRKEEITTLLILGLRPPESASSI